MPLPGGGLGGSPPGPRRRSRFPRTPLLSRQNWLEEFGTRSGVFISHLGYERGDWGSALLLVPVCTHLASPAAPSPAGRSRVAVGCPGSSVRRVVLGLPRTSVHYFTVCSPEKPESLVLSRLLSSFY